MFDLLKLKIMQIRKTNPIILNLSNLVSMDFLANGLLAIGASPIMSDEIEEMEELVTLANVININTGTVTVDFFKMTEKAAEAAKKLNKPIVFDPVGSGASNIRTMVALRLLVDSSIVKGNASEILSLGKDFRTTRGVDSANDSIEAVDAAKIINAKHGATVIVTGETDIVLDSHREKHLPFGCSLMRKVTGMGCLVGAIAAVFHAVERDAFQAAVLATTYMALCGELANRKAQAPGSFKLAFIDALYSPDFDFFKERLARMEEECHVDPA